MQTKLQVFTRNRNWVIARMRGSASIFGGWSLDGFSKEIQEEGSRIRSAILHLERKLSATWPEQKAHYLKSIKKNRRIT